VRPIATKQTPIRSPLNYALGTKARVRILRVLTREPGGPFSVAQLAQLTGVTAQGVRKSIEGLEAVGVVRRIGGGKNHRYELRAEEKLVEPILKLFEAEDDVT